MKRLLIRQNGNDYRFLQFEFRDNADGSFNIIFDRQPTSHERIRWTTENASPPGTQAAPLKKFRISYHGTGRVNFHGMSADRIYCEPTHAITQPHVLAVISIPAVERLSIKCDVAVDDAILELPSDLSGRLTFALTLIPSSFTFDAPPLVLITYPRWFSLAISMGSLPTAIAKEHFVKMVPQAGRCQIQCLPRQQALIAFHQKRMNSPGRTVMYWQAPDIYRLIFAVPMRVPPSLHVQFMNDDIQAEVEPLRCQATATAEVRFRARGPGGYLTTPQAIRSIELDAEL